MSAIPAGSAQNGFAQDLLVDVPDGVMRGLVRIAGVEVELSLRFRGVDAPEASTLGLEVIVSVAVVPLDSGEPKILVEGTQPHYLGPDTGHDLWTVRLGEEPVPFSVTSAFEHAPAFSPDGRWLAFISDRTGRKEIYVQPYPGPGERVLVSSSVGNSYAPRPDSGMPGLLFVPRIKDLPNVTEQLGNIFTNRAPKNVEIKRKI